MRSARSLAAGLGGLAVALAVGLAGPAGAAAAPSAQAAAQPESRPAAQVLVRVGDRLPASTVVADPAPAATLAAGATAGASATFNVTYSGFSPAAKAAFQRAVNGWQSRISSPVPITVRASFERLGSGVLGSAGPNSIWRDFAGARQANTWYVDALANKLRGRQLSSTPDIVARFNSGFSNWHYGTDAAPRGKYDFTSVVTHELGHGLGFLGAGEVRLGRGTVRVQTAGTDYPTSYDRFTETGAGRSLLSFPDQSGQLASALKSGSVYFDSAAVRTANNGSRVRLYAPGTWQRGSSYSHLNEATYPPGNPNSLMTPQISAGETVRSPGAISMAILRSQGW